MPNNTIKQFYNHLNKNNNLAVALISLFWFLIGMLLPNILLLLEGKDWAFDIISMSAFYPMVLAFQMLWEGYILLAILSLGLYIYPVLLLLGLVNQDDCSPIHDIKHIMTIIFAFVLFAFFIHAFPTMSDWKFKQYFGNDIYHSHYWIFCAFVILPIHHILKVFLIEINYRVFIVLFVLGYGAIGYLQYQKYLTANELEKEKYFNKYILYTNHQPSGIPYVPLPDVKVDYDTVIELNQNPAVEPDDVDILQNYQVNGFLYRHYDVCFKYHCPNMIKQSLAKQPNYYLNINRTDTRIDYELLDENKASLWRASSHKIDTYDKFYNKTQEFHPDYHHMIKDKFKLYHHLLIGHDDIVIHDDEFNNKLTKEQRRASNALKDEQLTNIFSKNSPFHKSGKNSDCHFEVIGDNIHINDGFFKHKHHDLRSYHLWCSSDYYVLAMPKFDRIWGNEQYLYMIDRKTDTPLLALEEFAHIFNKNIIANPNNETFVNGNNKELLTTHPNGFEIKAISFKWVYYDEANKAWRAVDDKSQLPNNHFWYAVAVHTEFGDIFYRPL